MKKKFIVAAICALSVAAAVVLAASVHAQTVPAPSGPPAVIAVPVPAVTSSPAKAPDAVDFTGHKQKLLENIGGHIAKMKKRQACIEAAVDEKALNACRFSENETAAPAAPAAPAKQ